MNRSFNSVSIVIPTFNEEGSLKPLVDRIDEVLSKAKIT